MDAERFDAIARLLHSRRALVGRGAGALVAWLSGGQLAGAGQRCRPGQKRCGKRCIPKQECCPRTHRRCGEKCIRKSACCPGKKRCGKRCIPRARCCTNADCGPRRLCARVLCVTGQGTCFAGADICNVQSPLEVCGQPRTDCACFTSTTDQTRCGGGDAIDAVCGDCLSDADCAGKYPGVPGAFCVQVTGTGCVCPGSTFCSAPCPG